MTRFTPKTFLISAAILAGMAAPAAAQSAMSASQCETMMMAGTQNYTASAVAGCTAYFQSLADGALAPGTFASVRPSAGALIVTASSSGSGG